MEKIKKNQSSESIEQKSESTTPTWKRILAMGALLLLLTALVVLIYTLATSRDSGTILACLFILMVVPCIFYLFQWFRNILKKHQDTKH